MKLDAKPINLKNKALDLLSRREYGYQELLIKLRRYVADDATIIRVLDELKQESWLSEERFIANYINNRQVKYGIQKLRYDLMKKNVSPEVLDQFITNNFINEYENAYKIWYSKFGELATNNKDRITQARFLYNRGFSRDVINKIVFVKH